MRYISAFIASIALSVGAVSYSYAKPILAVTSELPPFSMSASNKGISHELVVEMGKRAGVEIEVAYMPWGEAQKLAKTRDDVLLFSVGRTIEREQRYKWIAHMVDARNSFVTVNGVQVNSFEQARKLDSIVVLGETAPARQLHQMSFENVRQTDDAIDNIKMLCGGKTQAWLTIDARAIYYLIKRGMDPKRAKIGAPLDLVELWLAAHPEFDAQIANRLADALRSIKEDGSYSDIISNYL